MKCWLCGAEQPDPEFGKVPFRSECDKCRAALHCCRNCKYYHPGMPNDCEVPGTEFIFDRTKANVCEEFKLRLLGGDVPKTSVSDIEERLFGATFGDEPSGETPKDRFDNLFKDD